MAAQIPTQLMPTNAHPDAPITARRFLSLFAKGGDDDMFSFDLKSVELRRLLGHLERMGPKSSLFIFSLHDEYVPFEPDDVQMLGKRIADAAGKGSTAVFIPSADHAISSLKAQHQMLLHAEKFIDKLYTSGVHELKVVENFQLEEKEDFEAFESEDTLSILNRYIEESETNLEKSTVQKIIQDVYQEACEIV